MSTSPDPFARYHRQMRLPGFGVDAQHRLAKRAAVLIGCGALGTVIAEALVRAGVGRVVIVDRDVVELTNLQRQTLFDETHAAEHMPKALAAAARLRAINSGVDVVPIVADVTPRNIETLLDVRAAVRMGGGVQHEDDEDDQQHARLAEVVIDATDNFQTRYLINDACVKHHVPLVYGGAIGTGGMTMTILPGREGRACMRCVFPEPPAPGTAETCETAGVLGPAAGVIASLQAAEAIKIVAGHADLASDHLRQIDVWTGQSRSIALTEAKDPSCVCCGKRRFEFLDAPSSETWSLCGANAVQVTPAGADGLIDLGKLRDRLSPLGTAKLGGHMLRVKIKHEGLELTVFRDARAIIAGTNDPVRARAAYAKYIGE